jgi:hypothetical protein
MKLKNNFGVKYINSAYPEIDYPSDDDPRWEQLEHEIDPSIVHGALPIGTVVHPIDKLKIMKNFMLYFKIDDIRRKKTLDLLTQREEKIKNEKKRIEKEKKRIQNERQTLKKKISKMKDEYDRAIRQITRSVHGKYKPEILKLENELKKINFT